MLWERVNLTRVAEEFWYSSDAKWVVGKARLVEGRNQVTSEHNGAKAAYKLHNLTCPTCRAKMQAEPVNRLSWSLDELQSA